MPPRAFLLLPLLVLILLPGCRNEKAETIKEKKKQDRLFFTTAPEEVEELKSNRMANEPTDYLRNFSGSKIHWQPWSSEVFDMATRSQRLIFICAGSNGYATSRDLLAVLDRDFADLINERYLPVLADSETDPALALACQTLAAERKEAVAFPFLIWLSHEGNPVAWTPIVATDEESLAAGFTHAEKTIESIVARNPRYVVENSRYDNEQRVSRQIMEVGEASSAPGIQDLLNSYRQLEGLYDSVDKRFDGTGGLPPGNLINSLARMAAHPACPENLRADMNEATRDSLDLILRSAVRDPLEGSFFMRRKSESFNIPALTKHLSTQAEMLGALSSVEDTPMVAFSREELLDYLAEYPPLSSNPANAELARNSFFWSMATVEKELEPDEANVFKKAFELTTIGNISALDDPGRGFFRKNSLGLHHLPAEMAPDLGLTVEETEALYESAVAKIGKLRGDLVEASGGIATETRIPLAIHAKHLSALCLHVCSQPDDAARLEEAKELAARLLGRHLREGQLYRMPLEEGFRDVPAFGNDYACLLEALLALHRITLDPSLIEQARLVATNLLDKHLDENNRLQEYPVDGALLPFPVYNFAMVFGPSTWGTAYSPLNRLAAGGFRHERLDDCLTMMRTLLSVSAARAPVVHTDFLSGAVESLGNVTLVIRADASARLLALLAGKEFDGVCLVAAGGEGLPDVEGAAVLLVDGQEPRPLATVEEIPDVLRSTLAALK